jgi:hypothetical protein
MKKEHIIELIRNKEKELYSDYRHCQSQYGVEHKHTRFALGAWGSVLNLLETIETIEEYENN